MPLAEFSQRTITARREILDHPGEYGYFYRDQDYIAPAVSDPYIIERMVGLRVLDQLRGESGCVLTLPEGTEDTNNFLLHIFQDAHGKAGIFFRPYAKDYLETLMRAENFAIVTYSEEAQVKAQLADHLGLGGVTVLGRTPKQRIDPAWDWENGGIQEHVMIPGFKYPIAVRHRQYVGLVTEKIGVPDLVVGDILPIDILPFTLRFDNSRGIFMTSPRTLPGEMAYCDSDPNLSHAASLEEVIQQVYAHIH